MVYVPAHVDRGFDRGRRGREQRLEATGSTRAGERIMGKADIHMHTSLSDGLMSVQEILDWVQEKTDLDVIAVTDHDDLEGGLLARDLAVKGGYRFEVIPGIEVTTRAGHLLALFLEKP